MSRTIKDYDRKRAEAIREYRHLYSKLIGSRCSVDVINRAFRLKTLYNL